MCEEGYNIKIVPASASGFLIVFSDELVRNLAPWKTKKLSNQSYFYLAWIMSSWVSPESMCVMFGALSRSLFFCLRDNISSTGDLHIQLPIPSIIFEILCQCSLKFLFVFSAHSLHGNMVLFLPAVFAQAWFPLKSSRPFSRWLFWFSMWEFWGFFLVTVVKIMQVILAKTFCFPACELMDVTLDHRNQCQCCSHYGVADYFDTFQFTG